MQLCVKSTQIVFLLIGNCVEQDAYHLVCVALKVNKGLKQNHSKWHKKKLQNDQGYCFRIVMHL